MLDVLLYRVNKLCLILLDGTSNLGNEDRLIYFKGLKERNVPWVERREH